MLYTDLLGSRLLSARLKAPQIKAWIENPVITLDAGHDGTQQVALFDHLAGMNSTDCIAFLLTLAQN